MATLIRFGLFRSSEVTAVMVEGGPALQGDLRGAIRHFPALMPAHWTRQRRNLEEALFGTPTFEAVLRVPQQGIVLPLEHREIRLFHGRIATWPADVFLRDYYGSPGTEVMVLFMGPEDARQLAQEGVVVEGEGLNSARALDALAFVLFLHTENALQLVELQSDLYSRLRHHPTFGPRYQDWRFILRLEFEIYARQRGITRVVSPTSGLIRAVWPSIPQPLSAIVYDQGMRQMGYVVKELDEPLVTVRPGHLSPDDPLLWRAWVKELAADDPLLAQFERFLEIRRTPLPAIALTGGFSWLPEALRPGWELVISHPLLAFLLLVWVVSAMMLSGYWLALMPFHVMHRAMAELYERRDRGVALAPSASLDRLEWAAKALRLHETVAFIGSIRRGEGADAVLRDLNEQVDRELATLRTTAVFVKILHVGAALWLIFSDRAWSPFFFLVPALLDRLVVYVFAHLSSAFLQRAYEAMTSKHRLWRHFTMMLAGWFARLRAALPGLARHVRAVVAAHRAGIAAFVVVVILLTSLDAWGWSLLAPIWLGMAGPSGEPSADHEEGATHEPSSREQQGEARLALPLPMSPTGRAYYPASGTLVSTVRDVLKIFPHLREIWFVDSGYVDDDKHSLFVSLSRKLQQEGFAIVNEGPALEDGLFGEGEAVVVQFRDAEGIIRELHAIATTWDAFHRADPPSVDVAIVEYPGPHGTFSEDPPFWSAISKVVPPSGYVVVRRTPQSLDPEAFGFRRVSADVLDVVNRSGVYEPFQVVAVKTTAEADVGRPGSEPVALRLRPRRRLRRFLRPALHAAVVIEAAQAGSIHSIGLHELVLEPTWADQKPPPFSSLRLEGLTAGRYGVEVSMLPPGRAPPQTIYRELIEVGDRTTVRLTLPRFMLEPGTSIVVQVTDHATRPVYASVPLRVTLHDPSHRLRWSPTGKAMRALDALGALLLLPLVVASFLIVPPLIWAHGERALFRQKQQTPRQARV